MKKSLREVPTDHDRPKSKTRKEDNPVRSVGGGT